MRYSTCYWLVMAVAPLLLGADRGGCAEGSRRPNILFFLTDDQPQVCLGAMGNPHIKTPHMDCPADPHEEKDHARDAAFSKTLSDLRARCDHYHRTLP